MLTVTTTVINIYSYEYYYEVSTMLSILYRSYYLIPLNIKEGCYIEFTLPVGNLRLNKFKTKDKSPRTQYKAKNSRGIRQKPAALYCTTRTVDQKEKDKNEKTITKPAFCAVQDYTYRFSCIYLPGPVVSILFYLPTIPKEK